MEIGPTSFHKDDAAKMIHWQPILFQDALSRFGLQGSEPQVFEWVASDQEPHGTIAQVADAVEEKDQIVRLLGLPIHY